MLMPLNARHLPGPGVSPGRAELSTYIFPINEGGWASTQTFCAANEKAPKLVSSEAFPSIYWKAIETHVRFRAHRPPN